MPMFPIVDGQILTFTTCGHTGPEYDAGSHRGGFIIPRCTLILGHEGLHSDQVWNRHWHEVSANVWDRLLKEEEVE